MRGFTMLLAAAAAPACALARSRASFDLGWRFVLGDLGFTPAGVSSLSVNAAGAAPSSSFPSSSFCDFGTNLTGTQ